MKTAVVFSAGGLFGAWEVGVWRELEAMNWSAAGSIFT
jgi:predicted acylesterase/phospholipase RssA